METKFDSRTKSLWQEMPRESPRSGKHIGESLLHAGAFTVTVPRGWSVVDAERDAIILESDDDCSAISIVSEDKGGMSLWQVALQLSRELEGTRPVLDATMCRFSFFDDEAEGAAVFVDAEDQYMLILLFGDVTSPDVAQILNSVGYYFHP